MGSRRAFLAGNLRALEVPRTDARRDGLFRMAPPAAAAGPRCKAGMMAWIDR